MGRSLMNKFLFEKIINFINKTITDHPNSIFVIKGLPNFYDDRFEFLFNIQLDKVNKPNLANEIITNLNGINKRKNYIVHYHELLVLNELKLFGVFTNFGEKLDLKIKLINIDLFFERYPSFDKNIDWKFIYDEFTKESKNIYHSIISNLIIEDNSIIFSYVDLDIEVSESFLISELISQIKPLFYETEKSSKLQTINLDSNLESLLIAITKILLNDLVSISIINSSKNTISKNKNYIFLQFLHFSNVKIYVIQELPLPPKSSNKLYLNVLRRKNPTFTFRDLKIYKNPSIYGNEINVISQEVIIDEIYTNILRAKDNNYYTDTFVTSPTGSGKSIMFQIPAILAAEEHNLITIIISPLIGLMNNQVSNITSLTSRAATINSDISPIEKDQIKEKLVTKDSSDRYICSILYISPETLLSNRDIKVLIGDRKIGLVVIDEAHIVATWGKSFRPDYWYLGEYLRYLRKEDHFPIAAFTATAVFGGSDDMYYDILDSLFLNVNRPYLGVVKRENIRFEINLKQKLNDYEKEKRELIISEIKHNLQIEKKSLYYFPYKSIINKIHENAKLNISQSQISELGVYVGGVFLNRVVKQQTLDDFGSGKIKALLATKAFGMGIDIDDIDNVYHYAPTGNLADYVQEVGRIARKTTIEGVAKTDYFEEDFRYIKQLYGLSAIKQYEVTAVVKKILDIYSKEKKRNFMVSPETFAYIFGSVDYDEVETRLKTILLIIKKDLETTKGLFPYAFIFRPRTMFTEGLFLITDEDKNSKEFEELRWDKYIKVSVNQNQLESVSTNFVNGSLVKTKNSYLGSLYELDFKSLWEERYRDLSFGSFKHAFYENQLTDEFKKPIDLKNYFKPKVMVDLKTKDNIPLKAIAQQMREFLNVFDEGLSFFKNQGKHFSIEDFSNYIKQKELPFKLKNNQLGLIISSILNLLNNTLHSIGSVYANDNFLTFNGVTNLYSVKNVLYKKRISYLLSNLQSNFGVSADSEKRFISNGSKNKGTKLSIDPLIIISQIAELLDLVSYKIKAGDNAQFFMRVNSEQSLLKIANVQVLSKTIDYVRQRHNNSIDWMKYFFEKLTNDEERWHAIEKYFLGTELEELYKN
jgi:ATP-dependent DNA helicase RecQ